MDFRDSPEEAEFRARLRAWIAENDPGLPVSSTDDEYWARQAEWHTALYDAGFFGLSWPKRFGGHEMPSVFDVILDDEIAAAGAPPRPSLGYLVQGITTHASEAIQERFLPGLISGEKVGALAFGRQGFVGAPVHGRRGVAPDPCRLGRLPLHLTGEDVVRLGRLPPVDDLRRISDLVVAVLPEGLALADPAPAVHALDHGRGNPLGGDQQRRQGRRQLLGALAQVVGTLDWAQDRRPPVRLSGTALSGAR